MKKIVRLTESDLTRIVRRVISEQVAQTILIDGQAWKFKRSDSLKHGNKAVDITMTHVPSQGKQSLGEKTWTVGCNRSINPPIKSNTTQQNLLNIAAQHVSC
jgi:hypothetical protein